MTDVKYVTAEEFLQKFGNLPRREAIAVAIAFIQTQQKDGDNSYLDPIKLTLQKELHYPCRFDHNGECLVCDCFMEHCGFKRYLDQDYEFENKEELDRMFKYYGAWVRPSKSPQEKALEIIHSIAEVTSSDFETVKRCALLVVDEVIKTSMSHKETQTEYDYYKNEGLRDFRYYREVRKEIKKL